MRTFTPCALGFLVACMWSQASAAEPATRPARAEIQKLIFQLGEADAALRESAAVRLKEIGKDALPALKEAAKSSDLEISAAAAGLAKRIERRIPLPNPALAGRTSVRTTIRNGQRTMDVTAGGLEIHIIQSGEAIDMSVTGVEDGKAATVNFKAKTPDELKTNDPEAHALWDRWYASRNRALLQRQAIAPGALRIAPQIQQIRAEQIELKAKEDKARKEAEAAREQAEQKARQAEEEKRQAQERAR